MSQGQTYTTDFQGKSYTFKADYAGGDGNDLVLTLQSIDAAPQLVIVSQPPVSVTAGAAFMVSVAAEDGQGNIDTGFTGTITVALAGNPGSSTLGGTLTAVATNGVAVFSNLTLNKVGIGYTLQVAGSGLLSTTSSAISVSPGVATQLVIVPQSLSAVTATALFNLTVAAEDAEGNLTPGFAGNVTVSLADNPGSSTLGGATTVSAVGGVAVFSGLSLNNTGTGYQLSISGGDLTSPALNSFDVTPKGVATQLIFLAEPPSSVSAGSGFDLTVEAVDGFGTLGALFAGSVTLGLANNPGGGTLSGTTMVSAVGGIAVFQGLSINNVGNGYTLLAAVSGLNAAETSSLSVTPGTLTLPGSVGDNVEVTFLDATDFSVTVNGTTSDYSTANVAKVVYGGPSGAFSKVIFFDPSSTDSYAATQSFDSTSVVRDGAAGFEFDATDVANLYVYVSDPNSTATINVGDGGSASSNFFASSFVNGNPQQPYSYIAKPTTTDGIYSELSGFGSETVTGVGNTVYAYIYSTTNAAVVAGPEQTTFTLGGVMTTLMNFPTVYTIGAADGTDSVTFDASGGQFTGEPAFSSVVGTFDGSPFTLGAFMPPTSRSRLRELPIRPISIASRKTHSMEPSV